MKMPCPDCGRPFFLEMRLLVMLKDSIRINPKLKIICGPCGSIIEKRGISA